VTAGRARWFGWIWALPRETLLLVLILAVGAALRLYGVNWDGGHWLHPDERQVYFITLDLGWPENLAQALRPDSPLNPGFFAYGSLPFYLLRVVATLLSPLWPTLGDPDNLHLVGRPLAALCDLGTVYLTYRLTHLLGLSFWKPGEPDLPLRREHGELDAPHPYSREGLRGGALFAAALISFAVLHVQQAHYYTADSLLTFFVMLTLYLAAGVARGSGRRHQVALGVALGLALATKVSAAPLLLVSFVAYSLRTATHGSRLTYLLAVARPFALTVFVAGVVFVVTQPYALIDWPTFLDHTLRESQIAWGSLDVPYTRQYAGTLPYLYSMWQVALWGLVLPVGLLAWLGFGVALLHWLRRAPRAETLLLAWAGPYLALTGLLYARYLRYMLPLVPVLCILVVPFLASPRVLAFFAVHPSPKGFGAWLVGIGRGVGALLSLAYVLAFARIYAHPHTWLVASEWIYRQVPAGSTLAVEDWDVALPLPLDVEGRPRRIEEYDLRALALYDEPDDDAKWEDLAGDLADSDYVILASRRLYGSIPRQTGRYPLTTRYYQQLLAGNLGFELVGEFTRGPAWLNPRIPPLPDAGPALFRPDESFVVYDHPRTLLFRNVQRLSPNELLRRVGAL
jgi:hypothetical protein